MYSVLVVLNWYYSMEHLIKMIKITFIFSMLAVNLLFISLPSIKMFLKGGIVIEVSTETLDDLPSPAFAISRIGADELLVLRVLLIQLW